MLQRAFQLTVDAFLWIVMKTLMTAITSSKDCDASIFALPHQKVSPLKYFSNLIAVFFNADIAARLVKKTSITSQAMPSCTCKIKHRLKFSTERGLIRSFARIFLAVRNLSLSLEHPSQAGSDQHKGTFPTQRQRSVVRSHCKEIQEYTVFRPSVKIRKSKCKPKKLVFVVPSVAQIPCRGRKKCVHGM